MANSSGANAPTQSKKIIKALESLIALSKDRINLEQSSKFYHEDAFNEKIETSDIALLDSFEALSPLLEGDA